MKKIYLMICLLLIIFLTSCAEWDLIGRGSVEAFERVLDASQGRVFERGENLGWILLMSLRDESAPSFSWRSDFSSEGPEFLFDVGISIPMRPFIDAGFDISSFYQTYTGLWTAGAIHGEINTLTIGANFGERTPELDNTATHDEATPLASFQQMLRFRPEIISYHDTGHHYMLHLGDSGNMIMFARDIDTNPAGMVFMLNPQPFTDAGADVHNIEGWHYGPHETMTIRGQRVTRYFLTKTFDLRSAGMP